MEYNNSFYTKNPLYGKNICLIVPHEDDEVLTIGAVLPYLASCTEIYIVITTNGDFGGIKEGIQRINETRRALALLGVPEKNILFLGYSDQATTVDGKTLYEAGASELCEGKSKISTTYGTDEYWCIENIKTRYGRPMTYDNLVGDIDTILRTLQPEYIFSIGLDGHTDHDGVSHTVDTVLNMISSENGYSPIVFKMLAHTTYWLGKYDYSSWNNPSTVASNQIMDELAENDPTYLWQKRVRFPISREFVAFPSGYKYFSILKQYKTQRAQYHFARALNSDVVFFPQHRENSIAKSDEIVMLKLLYKGSFVYTLFSTKKILISELGVYALYSDYSCNYLPLDDERIEVFSGENKITFSCESVIKLNRTGQCVTIRLKENSAVFDCCVFKLFGAKELLFKYIEKIVLATYRVVYKIIGRINRK